MHRSILASLVFLLACGSNSGDDPDAGADGAPSFDARATADAAPPDAMANPTLDDLCGLDGGYASFFDALLACNPEFEFFLGRFPTPAEISAACYGNFEPYFTDGTMSLGDAEAWLTCLDYIATIDCLTADFDAPNPCTALIIGSQTEGADCEDHDQCAGDAYCDFSEGVDCGVCAPQKDNWEPCDHSDQCISGLCDSTQSVCRPYGQIGAVCASDDECTGRLMCDLEDTGLCIAPPVWQAGDDCANYTEDCGWPFSELLCDVEGLGGTNKCVSYFSVGDDCVATFQCDFRRYEICDVGATDKCLAPTIVGESANCRWWDGTQCDAGFRCTDPASDSGGTCIAEPQLGDSCESSDECGVLMDCSDSECSYGDYSGMCPALD